MNLELHTRRWSGPLVLASLVSWFASASADDQVFAPVPPAPGDTSSNMICGREFATIGGGVTTDKLRIDPAGAENLGHEIGRFWASDHSGQANNFDGSCPSQSAEQPGGGWWEPSQPPLRGIRAFIGEPGCDTSGCPLGPLTVLVEDLPEDDAGWSAPYFIALQVDPTPSEMRWWDLARVDPGASPGILPMQPFPGVIITSVESDGLTQTVHFLFEAIDAGVHAVRDPGIDTPLPASAVVKSYDLYHHVGNWNPGRFATDWTLVEQFPYQDGPNEGVLSYECPWGTIEDEQFAVGLTFHGGDGPEVRSTLVRTVFEPECFDPRLPASALGVLEYGTNPCTGTADVLVLTDPCRGSTSMVASPVYDLEQSYCEAVFVDGYELLPSAQFQCHSVDVYHMEPAEPNCLVQVRSLAATRDPEGVRLEWSPLPCSDDYDVIRGNLVEIGEGDLGTTLCIDNDTVLLDTLDETGQDPEPGDGFFYLVRSRGTVGSAYYGHTSAGTERTPALGDCPLD